MIEEDKIDTEDNKPKAARNEEDKLMNGNKIEIDIIGPLSFWLAFLVLGVIIQLVLIPIVINLRVSNGSLIKILSDIGGWILYMPGALILPLVISLWMGERIGATKNKVKSAITIGIINAIYTVIVYIIAIFIIYLLISYIEPSFISGYNLTLVTLAEYVIAIPAMIVLILVPFIASLSAARHKNIE
ncbi:MAG: hypothetical protein M1538_03270 [Candidatus Marsarchaeota archaeon]|jgi:Fe2+ transport system protein B|nr:hypothetical protein [Candidatus Marsarchaeota archaeon]